MHLLTLLSVAWSPDTPLLFSFDWQVVHAVFIASLLVLGFHFLVVLTALLLSELLSKDGLMALVTTLLSIKIIKVISI